MIKNISKVSLFKLKIKIKEILEKVIIIK